MVDSTTSRRFYGVIKHGSWNCVGTKKNLVQLIRARCIAASKLTMLSATTESLMEAFSAGPGDLCVLLEYSNPKRIMFQIKLLARITGATQSAICVTPIRLSRGPVGCKGVSQQVSGPVGVVLRNCDKCQVALSHCSCIGFYLETLRDGIDESHCVFENWSDTVIDYPTWEAYIDSVKETRSLEARREEEEMKRYEMAQQFVTRCNQFEVCEDVTSIEEASKWRPCPSLCRRCHANWGRILYVMEENGRKPQFFPAHILSIPRVEVSMEAGRKNRPMIQSQYARLA